jgi:hypothetical protein
MGFDCDDLPEQLRQRSTAKVVIDTCLRCQRIAREIAL